MNTSLNSYNQLRLIFYSVFLGIFIFASGCSSLSSYVPIKGIPKNSSSDLIKKIAQENTQYIQDRYSVEEVFYKDKPVNRDNQVARPELCLALSGGGMRSAAFSLGVLKGLHIKNILNDIGIISTVSGGTYAASWYYAQLKDYYPNATKLFDTDPLSTGKDLRDDARLVTFETLAPDIVGSLLLTPAYVLENGVMNVHDNSLGLQRKFYRDRLREIFQEGNSSTINPKDRTLLDLKSSIKNKEQPYFIFNATAVNRWFDPMIAPNLIKKNKYLHEIFEFTPLFKGNDMHGYAYYEDSCKNFEAPKLDQTTAISGAAVDISALTDFTPASKLLSMLNLDLGVYIEGHKEDSCVKNQGNYGLPPKEAISDAEKNQEVQAWRKVPLLNSAYLALHYNDPRAITDIYLTDGGQSEHLGLFSAVKRMCKNIIVVDAEFDKNYEFGSYQKLKKRLKDDMSIAMSIPGIDTHFTDNGCPKCNKKERIKEINENPVMIGKITGIPLLPKNGTPLNKKGEEINLAYIKLSMDKDRDDAESFYGPAAHDQANKPSKLFKAINCISGCFPMQSTFDQNFSEKQFNGYRDLGCRISDTFLNAQKNPNDTVSLSVKAENTTNKKCFDYN